MNHFFIVAQQVLILFILMAIGYICNKFRLLSKEANKGITNLVIYLVTPCVIIQSFERPFDYAMFVKLMIFVGIAVAIHLLMILLAHLLIHDKDQVRERVMRFGTVFSNAGFVALPLIDALLGAEGVFYGAAFLAIFNIFLWSYGVIIMGGNDGSGTLKKILVNPGIIGVVLGILVFVFSVSFPPLIQKPIAYMASLNVPLPMILVGYYIAEANLLDALRDGKIYYCMALRLLLIPLLVLGILYLCGLRGVMLTTAVICASAPVGATTTIFAERYDRDVSLSVKLVALSTLLSMITIPLVVGLAQMIA